MTVDTPAGSVSHSGMGKTHRRGARQSFYKFEYRITLLGDSEAGKTSLVNQFVNHKFSPKYMPTVEDRFTHVIEHKGNMCVCLLVDTSGSPDFPAMRRLSIVKGNVCLVVYSITSRRSFEAAKRTVEEIKSLKNPSEDVKIVVVGNKVDCSQQRKVDFSEGENYANEINVGNVSSAFYETTATDTEQVMRVFRGLLDMFIPLEVPLPEVAERKSFSRLSLRRKTRKSSRCKQQTQDERKISDASKGPEYYSDSEIVDDPVKTPPLRRTRTNSVDGLPLTDEDASSLRSEASSTSPSVSPKMERRVTMARQNSAKVMLNKAFGSMQRLFKTDSKSELHPTSTFDSLGSELHRTRNFGSIKSLGRVTAY